MKPNASTKILPWRELSIPWWREAVRTAIPEQPSGGTIRILEIGGGTGGTTAHILPRLVADGKRVSYVFTDISPHFTGPGSA